ncbi:MAG: hypothetical protein KGL52_14075 [Rhodospirillales bacterium]|nr:hypothetical protein [Rhodospirillales bacterium]
MARSGGYSVTITATDKASATIDRINKRLRAANALVERLGKSFNRLAANTGFSDVVRGMRTLRQETAGLASSIGRFAPTIAGLAGAGSVAGVGALAARYADFGSNLYLTARQARTTVPHLQRLEHAAALAGGSAQGAGAAFVGLQNNLQSAFAGHNAEATAALSQLGVNWRGANGALPADKVMRPLLHKLAAVKNLTLQAKLGNMIFGGSFSAIQPLLLRGVRGLDRYTDAGSRMVTMTTRSAERARMLQEQIRRLTGDVETTAMATLGRLVPAAGGAADAMSKWIEANQNWIATNVSGDIRAVAGEINRVVGAVGGWKSASADLGELWLARLLPGMLGGLLRVDVLLRTLSRWGGYKSIAGMTDAQRAAYLGKQEENFARTKWRVAADLFGHPTAGAGAPRLPTTGGGRATMAQAQRYFLAHGWSAAQTAGILSNMSAESGFNAGAVGDHGTSFGLFQWHNGRARMLEQFARQHGWRGGNPATIPVATQLAFAQWELTQGDQRGAGAALRMARSPQAAGAVFSTDYERPADGAYQAASRGAGAVLFMPPAPPQTHTVKGAAHVHIDLSGAPVGTRVSAHTDGDLFAGAPRVTMPLPPGGGPG